MEIGNETFDEIFDETYSNQLPIPFWWPDYGLRKAMVTDIERLA